MKWIEPRIGDVRIKEKFLIFPKKIHGETRWLERAKWKEVYTKYNYINYNWEATEWEN